MPKYIFLLVFSLSTITVFSQKEFAPGYIITVKNDTVRGDVMLFTKNEMDYYVKVMFRNKPNGGTKQYLPAKIHGYGVEERNYAALKYYDMWVYMQVVCKGRLTFYEYKPPVAMGNDKMQSQYFILKSGDEEMQQIFPDSKVKRQIKGYIADDKELLKEMDDADMHYAELVQLIERYNERNQK